MISDNHSHRSCPKASPVRGSFEFAGWALRGGWDGVPGEEGARCPPVCAPTATNRRGRGRGRGWAHGEPGTCAWAVPRAALGREPSAARGGSQGSARTLRGRGTSGFQTFPAGRLVPQSCATPAAGVSYLTRVWHSSFWPSADPGECKHCYHPRCSPVGSGGGGAAPFQDRSWVRIRRQHLVPQGREKPALFCSPAAWGLLLGHGDPPMAGVRSCQRGGLPQSVGAPPSWEAAVVRQPCSPPLPCTSGLYRAPVAGAALPAKRGSGSLVGQLVQLLPQLWLLLEEVRNYWRGRSHEHLFLVKNRGHWCTFQIKGLFFSPVRNSSCQLSVSCLVKQSVRIYYNIYTGINYITFI